MFYHEPPRETPIIDQVDVLVLGGGPAGFGAALYAAREGAKTLLVEQEGELGGVATTGLMSHWTGNTKGGVYEELLERSRAVIETDDEFAPLINHPYLCTVMADMLTEAGARVRLYTQAVAPIMEGNRVTGGIFESKSGREAVMAKIVIDCTGDGDIAARAGAEFVLGREGNSGMQPMTHMVQLAGVDRSHVTYVKQFEFDWVVDGESLQQLARRAIPAPAGHVLIYPTVFPGNVILNMTNCIGVDGTNADDLTRADLACRSQIPTILGFLQKHAPGFEKAYVIKVSSRIGVRETRHFVGLETITEQDIRTARVFDNWAVTRAHFNFDVHNISGAGLDETGEQEHFSQPNGYTIPYGCFVPVAVDGLLLAGRNISGTHKAHSNYRVMPICVNMGQATGIAAAMCAKADIQPRDLDIRQLQQRLAECGVTP